MKYCPKCNCEIDTIFILCPTCGAELEPVDESMSAEEAINAPADELPPPEFFEPVLPKKKNEKKIALIAIAVLLFAAAVVACVLLLKPTPKEIVDEAYGKTMLDLEEVFSGAENLNNFVNALVDIADADKYHFDIDINLDYYTIISMGMKLSSDADNDTGTTAGEISIFTEHSGMREEINVSYSSNAEAFMVQMPQYLEGTYGFELTEDWVDSFYNSYIYKYDLSDMLPVEDLTELLPMYIEDNGSADLMAKYDKLKNAWAKLVESLDYEESEKSIPKCKSLDIYEVIYDKEALVDVMDLLSDYLEASGSFTEDADMDDVFAIIDKFNESNLMIYVGINEDGYLSSVSFCYGDEYASLILQGKSNVWDSFTLYNGADAEMFGGFRQTNKGFQLRFTDPDDAGIIIACNDKAGKLSMKLIFEDDAAELIIPMYYEVIADGKGIAFELDLTDTMGESIAFTLRSIDSDVKMLDTEFTDILAFTEEEYQQFILELYDGIYGDAVSDTLGDDFTYENVFGADDVDYED